MVNLNTQQNEALQVHELYWRSYSTGDIKTLASLLDDHYTQIGSVENEVFFNKRDALKFIEDTIDQIAGNVDMKNRTTKVEQVDTLILISERCDLYVLIEGNWTFYAKFRASTFLQSKNGQWLIIHQHSSMPDTKAEAGENIALDKIAAENLQLKEAVQRRTIELEHQNRELEIETALERVRAVAMSMKDPADMITVCRMISDQVHHLGFENVRNVQTVIFDEPKHEYLNYQYFAPYNEEVIELIDYTVHPALLEFANNMLSSPDAFGKTIFENEALIEWREHRAQTNQLPDPLLDTAQAVCYYFYSIGSGALGISSYAPLREEHIALFKRFRNVFELAYRRFIDIQQAQSQAREAQIEVSLERVRARAMAMQTSDELRELIGTVFTELTRLDIALTRTLIMTFDPETLDSMWWMANSEAPTEPMGFPVQYHEYPPYLAYLKAWREKAVKFLFALEGQEKIDWDNFIFSETGLAKLPDFVIAGMRAPDRVYLHASFNNFGNLTLASLSPLPEEHFDILLRFAKVFDLTYTRFNDLRIAEAQAREARIEAALERVRSKAMAMHSSEDLAATINVFYHEIEALSITPRRCGVGLLDKESRVAELSTMNTTEEGKIVEVIGKIEMRHHPVLEGVYDNWIAQHEYHPVLRGNEIKKYYQLLRPQISLPDYPNDEVQYGYFFFFPEGGVYAWTHQELAEDELQFYRRFTSVLSLTYKRYKDLKYAEQQTHKAQIETALERVRARALAMQHPEELVEVSEVLRYEMGLLGVEELETCSIYIHDEISGKTECWYALKDLRAADKKLVSDHFELQLEQTWVGRQMLLFYESSQKNTSIIMKGEARKEWINYCEDRSAVLKGYYGTEIPERTYHLYKFSHGAIGAASAGDISHESWDLLQRASSVFSLAYSRFKDLTQARLDLQNLKEEKMRAETALKDLRATQTQLIQAEKMASLGELTAGIAHEIQNPLNFVNNFSEVNVELSEEIIDSIERGNLEEAKELAADIRSNQEKIREHGKRADGIVKSMLQHSRTSSGQKELKDLKILADEYLRLSYHGMRAKDKSFNADFELLAEPGLPMVSIIPQDIGRVILNLINNAFYAVNEKKKISSDEYKPKVTVSITKNPESGIPNPEYIQIRISDNGMGMTEKVKEKIFQPFFTTKPTGEGTGLGLSLSYEIITKGHGGEISVTTAEQSGTSFTIQLPIAKA